MMYKILNYVYKIKIFGIANEVMKHIPQFILLVE